MVIPRASLVIPTYNRANLIRRSLEFHLQMAENAPFPIEVIVSDNASTDNTADVLDLFEGHPNLVVIRRGENNGSSANVFTGFHQARGEVVTFIGDDDFLVPDAWFRACQHVIADSAIMMWQAPWVMFDEIQNRTIGNFYNISDIIRFNEGDYLNAFNMILDEHIFPEVCIYRRSHVFRMVGRDSHIMYWAFVQIARALSQGAVVFAPEPFAVFTSVSKHNRNAGNAEAMIGWDRYRGGIEYGLAHVFERQKLTETLRATLVAKLETFTAQRMLVARRLHLAARNYVEADELSRRIVFARQALPELAQEIKNLRTLAVFQECLREAFSLGGERIAVDPAIPDSIITALKESEQIALTRGATDTRSRAPFSRAFLSLGDDYPYGQTRNDLVVRVDAALSRGDGLMHPDLRLIGTH
jgi:glycosyltransferase involved in cell wall biosynthesis